MFGALTTVDVRSREIFRVQQSLQGITQRLASLAEGGADYFSENGIIHPGRHRFQSARYQANKGGIDLRRRVESAWADGEQPPRLTVVLDHHAQPSVIATAWRTNHAINDLLLQHEGHVDNAVALL